MASRSVRVRIINSLEPSIKIANARLAEKIVERIAHHATVDPAGWEAFAACQDQVGGGRCRSEAAVVVRLDATMTTLRDINVSSAFSGHL
jgi:hypothetical protein